MGTLVGIVIGALLGGVAQIVVENYRTFKEGQGIAVAIKAEIESVLTLVEERKYESLLQTFIDALRAAPEAPVSPADIFSVRIEQDYFSVFNAVRAKIGVLGRPITPVVRAYAFARSFIEDIRELGELRKRVEGGFIITKGAAANYFDQTRTFLSLAMKHGRNAVAELDQHSKRRWPYSSIRESIQQLCARDR